MVNCIITNLFDSITNIGTMKWIQFTLALFLGTVSLSAQNSVYQFSMTDIEGNEIPLSDYKGKVLLIVNVASKCGNTPQYEELQKFYEDFNEDGMVILGFPANNFLGQEPGSDEEILEFCTRNYQITFPLFSKISVKGKKIHPLYTYLTVKEVNGVIDAPVKWNFQKFLIGREGNIVTWFKPGASVEGEEIKSVILAELNK